VLGVIKTGELKLLGVERADDHQTGEVFTGNQVQPVNQVLNGAEFWQGDGEDDHDHHKQYSHSQPDDPGHGGAIFHRTDDRSHRHDWREEKHAQHHRYYHLHLGDVIG